MPTDSCCASPPTPPSVVTRRRALLVGAGAAAGGALALSGLPAAAQTVSSDERWGDGSGPGPSADGSVLHDEIPAEDYGFLPPRPASEVHRRSMMFPVVGGTSWSDTYLYPRGGGRRHEGQDLMANKMQKLVACVSGTIVELRHRSSGNSLYLKGDDGWYYCYLHINNDTPGTDDGRNLFQYAFAPGMANGVRVRKGDHVAFIGDSGNAEGSGAHCHFEIRMPNANWWNAAAVNPRYSLETAEPARVGPSVPPETFTPWTNSRDLIARQYQDFLGRTAAAANLSYWGGILDRGDQSPQQMMQYFLESAECDDKTHAVARLYQAFFLRKPDYPGFRFWADRRRGGQELTSIADAFARSPEFGQRYGTLSNRAFVDRIYRNVLGRPPDAAGLDFWTRELDRGKSRGKVMVHFSDSPENRARQRHQMHVVAAYGCMLRRMPTAGDLSTWTSLLAAGSNSNSDMLAMIRVSAEYRQVVTAG